MSNPSNFELELASLRAKEANKPVWDHVENCPVCFAGLACPLLSQLIEASVRERETAPARN